MVLLAPLGISPGQARALRVIGRGEGALRMSEVAARLDIAARSATGVVDSLEGMGLVSRTVDSGNRRVVLVGVTAEGEKVLGAMVSARLEAGEEVFSGLSFEDRDRLLEVLRKLDS
ncbi:MarR family winged helix-turn-helix transcriptional regulator [Nocardia panacis]|nr:MarR family transcriptional regulator [Nocardia panacis]